MWQLHPTTVSLVCPPLLYTSYIIVFPVQCFINYSVLCRGSSFRLLDRRVRIRILVLRSVMSLTNAKFFFAVTCQLMCWIVCAYVPLVFLLCRSFWFLLSFFLMCFDGNMGALLLLGLWLLSCLYVCFILAGVCWCVYWSCSLFCINWPICWSLKFVCLCCAGTSAAIGSTALLSRKQFDSVQCSPFNNYTHD